MIGIVAVALIIGAIWLALRDEQFRKALLIFVGGCVALGLGIWILIQMSEAPSWRLSADDFFSALGFIALIFVGYLLGRKSRNLRGPL